MHLLVWITNYKTHGTYMKIQTTHLVAVTCNLSQNNTLRQSQPKCFYSILIILMSPSLCTVPSQHFRTFQSSNFSFLDSSYCVQTSVTAGTVSSHTMSSHIMSSHTVSSHTMLSSKDGPSVFLLQYLSRPAVYNFRSFKAHWSLCDTQTQNCIQSVKSCSVRYSKQTTK